MPIKKKKFQGVRKAHVKTGDLVQIIAGKDKGYVDEVIEVIPKENRVRVKNANMITKHLKPRQQNQTGQIIQVEGRMNASNVLLYCDQCGQGVRTRKVVNEETGKKERVCVRCGKNLDRK